MTSEFYNADFEEGFAALLEAHRTLEYALERLSAAGVPSNMLRETIKAQDMIEQQQDLLTL